MADERVIRALIRFGMDRQSAQKAVNEIKRIEAEFGDAGKKAEEFGRKSGRAFEESGRSANKFTSTLGGLQAAAAALVAVFATSRIASFFTGLAKSAVQANSQFETFRTQFETLLGSTEAAQRRMEELARFGVETPFELPEIVEASRVLEVFGGQLLATGDNLRMVGDIAAGVNQPFADVALWIGRMYDAMQSGRPFGEAAARLQEMGALSGQARAELEAMQKTGASGAELWQRFNELVGSRFAGNMERLSQTLQGTISNLQDFRDNLMRIGGEALFDEAKESAQEFLDIISDEQMGAAIESLARALGEAAGRLADLAATPALESLQDLDPETIQRLAEALQDASAALSEFLDRKISADLNGLIDTVTVLIDTLTTVVNVTNRVKSATETVEPVYTALKDVIMGIISPVHTLIRGFKALNDLVAKLTGQEVADYSRQLAETSETERQAQEKLMEAHLEYARNRQAAAEAASHTERQGYEQVTEAVDEYGQALEKVTAATEKLSTETARKLEDMAIAYENRLAEAAIEASVRRADIERQHLQDIEDIYRDFAQKRIDEATDLSREEQDIARKFARQQADLQREAGQRRIEIEQDYRRELENIQNRFTQDAEDAVRNQDAIAFVKLQRRYRQELAQAEEKKQQSIQMAEEETRQRQEQLRLAQERELEDARLAHQRKLEDLRLALQRELAEAEEKRRRDLEEARINEERKRAELQRQYDQQLADFNRYLERRRADLEESLKAELALVREYEQKKRQNRLSAVERIRQSAQSRGSAHIPGRAGGGYAGPGVYRLGEAGTEFVLNSATTRALETALGARLTQRGVMDALAARGGVVSRNQSIVYSPQYTFNERDDAGAIMSQIEAQIDQKLLRYTRGY